MLLPETKFSQVVDKALIRIGEAISWVWLLLLVVIVLNVVMRYFFGMGRIEFEEIQWHLYAIGFLTGLSYAYVLDAHVRIDVVRSNLSYQTMAWIELYGTLLLLLPFILLVLNFVIPFVSYSYATNEVSEAPAGLPYRYLIKAMLGIGFVLLLVAVCSRLTRIWAFLFAWPRLVEEGKSNE